LSERREEYYAGITPAELGNVQKLLCLLRGNPAALELLVEGLEAVANLGNGEITLVIKQGRPVFVRYQFTKSLDRK
jgi:hypothetical protein